MKIFKQKVSEEKEREEKQAVEDAARKAMDASAKARDKAEKALGAVRNANYHADIAARENRLMRSLKGYKYIFRENFIYKGQSWNRKTISGSYETWGEFLPGEGLDVRRFSGQLSVNPEPKSFDLKDKLAPNGYGIYRVCAYSTYYGKVKCVNGEWVRVGYGIVTYDERKGSRYSGSFKDDKKEGYGVTRFLDGSSYKGEYGDGQATGYGLILDQNGNVRWQRRNGGTTVFKYEEDGFDRACGAMFVSYPPTTKS